MSLRDILPLLGGPLEVSQLQGSFELGQQAEEEPGESLFLLHEDLLVACQRSGPGVEYELLFLQRYTPPRLLEDDAGAPLLELRQLDGKAVRWSVPRSRRQELARFCDLLAPSHAPLPSQKGPSEEPRFLQLRKAWDAALESDDRHQILAALARLQAHSGPFHEAFECIPYALEWIYDHHPVHALDWFVAHQLSTEYYTRDSFALYLGRKLEALGDAFHAAVAYRQSFRGQDLAWQLCQLHDLDFHDIEFAHYDDAQQRLLDWVEEADPSHGEAWLALGYYQEIDSDEEEALYSYLRSCHLVPDREWAFESARACYEKFEDMGEGAQVWTRTQARLAQVFGHYPTLLSWLGALAAEHPQQAFIGCWLGDIHQEKDQLEQALTWYQRALRAYPHYSAALGGIRDCYYALEDWEPLDACLSERFYSHRAHHYRLDIGKDRLSWPEMPGLPIDPEMEKQVEALKAHLQGEEAWFRAHHSRGSLDDASWMAFVEFAYTADDQATFAELLFERLERGSLAEMLLLTSELCLAVAHVEEAFAWDVLLEHVQDRFHDAKEPEDFEALLEVWVELIAALQGEDFGVDEGLYSWSQAIDDMAHKARSYITAELREAFRNAIEGVYVDQLDYNEGHAERLAYTKVPEL